MNHRHLATIAVVIACLGLIGLYSLWSSYRQGAITANSPGSKLSVKEITPYEYDVSIPKDGKWYDTGIWVGDKIQQVRIWTTPNNPRQPFSVKIGEQEFKARLVTDDKSLSAFLAKIELGDNGLKLESEQKIFLKVDDSAQAEALGLKVNLSDEKTPNDLPILGVQERTFVWEGDVPGNVSWLQTGLWVRKNETLKISASGRVAWWPNPPMEARNTITGTAPPDGETSTVADLWRNNPDHIKAFPAPYDRPGCLVMMIGPNVYRVGSYAVIQPMEDGQVTFQVNDSQVADNTGLFHVVVKK